MGRFVQGTSFGDFSCAHHLEVDVSRRPALGIGGDERANGSGNLRCAVAIFPQIDLAETNEPVQATRIRHSQASNHIVILKITRTREIVFT